MVGLVYLSSGSTPTRGPYAREIRKITDYLLENCVTREGLITNPYTYERRPMYGHAFAMTFLANVLGLERDPKRQARLRAVLKRAVKMTIDVQSYEIDARIDPASSRLESM